jgi:CheY-like chemotaxis protein
MARILIIDDDTELRAVLRMALEEAGHQVAEAADGAKGIKAYRQRPADLILCDLVMPGKEGLETIRELRTQFTDARIVAMSGGTMNFLPIASVLGSARTLRKPFDIASLLEVVDETLGART